MEPGVYPWFMIFTQIREVDAKQVVWVAEEEKNQNGQ